MRAPRLRDNLGGALVPPPHARLIPFSSVCSRDRIIQDRKYSAPEPPLGRGGEGGGVGGGGSREEEARNPPPGNSSARQRSEALLSLGDRGRPSAAPARPGEARGESGGRRPAPRPPAAAESPGPAGAGRGGAWERLAGGRRPRSAAAGSAGSPSGSDRLAPGVRGALSWCGSSRSASFGACLLHLPPQPRGRSAHGRAESLARRGLPPFPPPRATSAGRRWRGAGGSPRRAPGGGRGAAPACAERGRADERREGHKGRRRARGPARGRGGGAPPGRS